MTACPDYELLLNGYLDDELDAANIVRVEQHLANCAGCSDRLARMQAVRDAVRSPELKFTAPAGLRDRIDRSVAAAAMPRRPLVPTWLTGGAVGALAASLALLVAFPRDAPAGLDQQLVAGHVRSLLADHLTDVRTTDRHIVKPWFNGRIDYAPPVPELADLGFPLFGGRLDVIDGQVVPAIVYRRRLHTINLFVLRGHGPAATSVRRDDGYSVVEWSQGGLRFAAVSDLDAGDLMQFRNAYASRAPH